MHKIHASVTLLSVCAASAVAILAFRADAPDASPGLEPDFRAEQFDAWSPSLEEGGSVKLVRRLCDTQKAKHLTRTGEPAPEIVSAGRIDTFGPLPERRAFQLAYQLERVAAQTLQDAEGMPAETLEDAHAQLREVLHGLKARAAATALRDGRYWTIRQNSHPRLPSGFSFWQMNVSYEMSGGVVVDVFVPLDLSAPELAASYEAVLSLEAEVRRDHSETFNRMELSERRTLAEDAWLVAEGGQAERSIPGWFWKLDVDRTTWMATPTAVGGR